MLRALFRQKHLPIQLACFPMASSPQRSVRITSIATSTTTSVLATTITETKRTIDTSTDTAKDMLTVDEVKVEGSGKRPLVTADDSGSELSDVASQSSDSDAASSSKPPPPKRAKSVKAEPVKRVTRKSAAVPIKEESKVQTEVDVKIKEKPSPRKKRAAAAAVKDDMKDEDKKDIIKDEEKDTHEETSVLDDAVPIKKTPAKRKAAASKKKTAPAPAETTEDGTEPQEAKPKKPRPPKKIVIPDNLDTAAMWERADKCGKYVGAHVSAAGGAHNAVIESVEYGGTAFALFVRNQRRWISPPIPEDQITGFEQVKTIAHFVGRTLPAHLSSISADRSLNLILPHGSYLINLAHADEERMLQAFEGFLDELKRCESLGINLYNFHPGAALDQPRPDAIQRISAAINKAHTQTSFITVVLENTAGGGSTLGVTFQELADIIDGVKDKSRVGVCLDTCHMFAAGYDIRTRDTYEASMAEFEQVVGFKYLKAMHINDSKQPFNSKKDRHEHLGKGEIGWDAFKFIMNDERLNGVPLILETPERDGGKYYKVEIDALYDLVGKAD